MARPTSSPLTRSRMTNSNSKVTAGATTRPFGIIPSGRVVAVSLVGYAAETGASVNGERLAADVRGGVAGEEHSTGPGRHWKSLVITDDDCAIGREPGHIVRRIAELEQDLAGVL